MSEGAPTATAEHHKHRSGRIVSLRPATESAGDAEGLKEAFELFGDLSRQLVDSYETLENRVSELNRELTSVSDRRMEELAEKEKIANRLETLINFLPGGVVVLDPAGRVIETNPAAVDLLDEPLEGMLWREVIARAFKPRSDDGHEVSLHDGRRVSIATRNLGGDGQIILLTDLTETRRLQSELSRHERLSAMGRMISALAHQIRTPLSTAMLYAGHLRKPDLDGQRREEFAGKLANRLNHIERQVQDMLLFVKGELPQNDTVRVQELEQGLREALEVPLATSDSQCQWHNHCSGLRLRCNREALLGALVNLANNSIQAVDTRAQLTVTFTHLEDKDGHWLAIELTDCGPGIDPQLLPRVGELFVTTKSRGTGLGLAVVQAVARAHSGHFDLDSTPGQGTRAQLRLPLTPAFTD